MRVISLLSTLPLAALASSNFKVQTRSSNSSGLDSLSSSNSSSSSSTSSSSQTNSTGSSSTSNSTSNGLPYETPDISHFKPSKGAHVAGKYSAKLCTWLGENFHKLSSEKITEAFGQYYPEGSNPSLELLSQTYPPGIIPANLDVAAILESVGPDIDITQDSDYGLQGREAQHGPLGGLPAFCRVGGNIATSDLTKVLFEVWLPVASDPSIDLAPINATDYPTASTPIELAADGSYIKGPPEVTSGEAAPSSTRSSGASARSLDENLEERSSSDFSGKELLGDSTGWNGRLLWINNGGQRGFVPLTDLKQQLSRHHFAVAGSNAGHFSTAGGASWINGTQYYDTLLDWSSRASHVGKIAAEEAINIFYGNQAGTRVSKKREHSSRKNAGGSGVNSPKSKNRLRAYMAGCSVGGKQSFGSATSYPDDFDGIIGGAPAFFFNRLNRGQVHTQVVHRKGIAKDGYFNITLLPGPIHQTILKQCDELDAVKDGVINDPTKCKPRFEEELLCGAVNSTFGGSKDTCLTQAQIDNLKTIYEPTILNGTFVYDQYFPGLESRVGSLTGAASKASQYTQLAILRYPQLDPDYDVYNKFTLETVLQGERDNPSGSNMNVTDLSPFLNAGKKFIHYHGLIDMTVSPAASIRYHDLAVKDSTPNLNGGKVSDGYRFFPIPGMSHCRDGDGAWHFGSITQNDAGNRPLKWDSKHDMILSLVAWVEHGEKPKEIIGGSYNSRSKVLPIAANSTGASDLKYLPTYFESNKYGIINTRKLCPYPQQAIYKGGPINGTKSYKSFECK